MRESDGQSGTAMLLRTAAVNWMLDFAEISDLPHVDPGSDMGALDRSRYERRLGLINGALSIGRFSHDFAGMSAPEVGERLLDEAFLGSIIRAPQAEPRAETEEAPADTSNDPEERFRRLLDAIGLAAGEVLVLSGSPDVSLHFADWGAAVPEVRRHPGRPDFSRYGLAIIGRGQAGHKDFEPWTQQIKSYQKHLGPTMITTPSSNVSGILEYLWTQRESIRRYVDVWRGGSD
jgi:hypothetical protein